MSLRPPLHVSTFQSRTVVSMFGRLCHLFVHALSSLQVANAQCMTLRSLAPCLRAAREKHRFAAGKKHRNGKKHVWQQEKNALQREKAVSAAGKKRQQKMPLRSGKNSKQQKKHLPAAQNAFWRQREKTVRGGKKPVRGKKKTGRGRKKTSSRESPALQPKKLPQRKKYISATGKSSSPKRTLCFRASPATFYPSINTRTYSENSKCCDIQNLKQMKTKNNKIKKKKIILLLK